MRRVHVKLGMSHKMIISELASIFSLINFHLR
jgi:hypothetical protein